MIGLLLKQLKTSRYYLDPAHQKPRKRAINQEKINNGTGCDLKKKTNTSRISPPVSNLKITAGWTYYTCTCTSSPRYYQPQPIVQSLTLLLILFFTYSKKAALHEPGSMLKLQHRGGRLSPLLLPMSKFGRVFVLDAV